MIKFEVTYKSLFYSYHSYSYEGIILIYFQGPRLGYEDGRLSEMQSERSSF